MLPDFDPEELFARTMDRHSELGSAGRQAMLDALQTYAAAADAFADAQDHLATMTNVESVSRLLRANATFTREVIEAADRFARNVIDDE